MKKKYVTFVAVFCMIVLIGVMYAKKHYKKPAHSMSQRELSQEKRIQFLTQILNLQKQSFTDSIFVFGDIKGGDDIDIKALFPAKIKKLYVKEGDLIFQDDVLVELENDDQSLKLEQALIEYEQAQELYAIGGVSSSELDKMRVKYEIVEKEYDKTLLKAPFDGLVGKRYVEENDVVGAIGRILRCINISSMEVLSQISEYDLPKIHNQQKVYVHVSAYPRRKFVGYVKEVSHIVEDVTRKTMVKIVIPNKEKKLKPGMFGKVEIVVFEKEDVYSIPIEAVSKDGAYYYVYVIRPSEKEERFGTITKKRLKPIYATMQEVVVKEGFTDGEILVLSPEDAFEGQQVEY